MKRTASLPAPARLQKKARQEAVTDLPPGPRLHIFVGPMTEDEEKAILVVKWHASTSNMWREIEAALEAAEDVGPLVQHFELASFPYANKQAHYAEAIQRAAELGVSHINHGQLGDWELKRIPGNRRKRPIHGPIHMTWPVSFGE